MSNGQTPQPPAPPPVANIPKQAIVVIHGMGEQMPMDTLKGFVHAAWETTKGLAEGNPREVWSKPDVRTGSLELRRITTRRTIDTPTFPNGVRSDFYELYWADLSGGSTWNQVKDWVMGLLVRNPFTRVPPDVRLAWLVLWAITLTVILLTVAASLKDPTMILGVNVWEYPPLSCLRTWKGWQLTAIIAVLGIISTSFIVPYFGRVVRYTRAKPDNVAARKNIRERGLALLSELHKEEYERIIVVGHSLGSILAYDLLSYFWARRQDARTVAEGTGEFEALRRIETALADPTWPGEPAVAAYRAAQTELAKLLRRRPRAATGPDTRWLITDFITVGSPLTHAEFLMAKSDEDIAKRQRDREFPISPPLRERLDDDNLARARLAGFPVDANNPKLLAYPPSRKNEWRLHHAAPFAAVRWTNIHDPALLVVFGDLISGPVAPLFGPAVVDVNLKEQRRLKKRGGQSWSFTHTKYWSLPEQSAAAPVHIEELRKALDLGGQLRPL